MAAKTISKSQIEALKMAYDGSYGVIGVDRGVLKALVTRGLAAWYDDKHVIITSEGRKAVETNFAGFRMRSYVPTSEHT